MQTHQLGSSDRAAVDMGIELLYRQVGGGRQLKTEALPTCIVTHLQDLDHVCTVSVCSLNKPEHVRVCSWHAHTHTHTHIQRTP